MEEGNSGAGKGTGKRKAYKVPSNYKFNCKCGKNFSLEKHFNAHRKKKHSEHEQNSASQKIPEKHCPLCNFSSTIRANLIKHLEVVHDILCVEEKLKFANETEFSQWKSKIEQETKSRFICKRTQTLQNYKAITFCCHRSGLFKSKGRGLRTLKTQGSVKINSFCPSRIVKKCFSNGTCTIEYTGTHIGHKNELKHLSLTLTEREELAKKIAMKIPFDDILDQIRDSIYDNSLQRIHLLNRKDLYNIETAYNLQSKAVRHKSDAVSVDAWVREMEEEGNCVLFYKPQGVYLENRQSLKQEDFFLIIMTDAQMDMLKKYGSDCVCLDGTHGLNSYDFELNTLLVLDELREGFPCAFLISNRSDTLALTLFFETIKDKLKETLTPKIFMSDLADTFFNAWVSVMGIPQKR